jgi:hypothetical protein
MDPISHLRGKSVINQAMLLYRGFADKERRSNLNTIVSTCTLAVTCM